MLSEPARGRMTSEAMSGTSIVATLQTAVGPSLTPSLVGKTAQHVSLARFFFIHPIINCAVSGQRALVRVLLAGRHRRARLLQVPRGNIPSTALLCITLILHFFHRDARKFSGGSRLMENGSANDMKLRRRSERPLRARRKRIRSLR